MMKKLIFSAVLIIVFLSACKNGDTKEKSGNNTVYVKTGTARTEMVAIPLHTSGKLTSATESKLSFKTGGVISRIYVTEGQQVQRGQVLAGLDLAEIQARKDQASLAVEKARRDYERAENLYRDSVATLETFQNAGTQLELAEANLKIAQFNLQHSSIAAPSAGKIMMKIASENEVIGAGYPVFLFGSTEGNWVVKCGLSDVQAVQVSVGDSASISFDAFPNRIFSAKITEIASFADPYTGTYELEITPDHLDVKLVSGLVAKVDIFPQNQDKFISVPIEALIQTDDLNGYVYEWTSGEAVMKKVVIEKILDDRVLIRLGISEGAVLITEGVNYIGTSSDIRIDNENTVK
ncbi:MAG: efflux RND transporter periplasmic adaptor subunit [Bacteroidota bacterium]